MKTRNAGANRRKKRSRQSGGAFRFAEHPFASIDPDDLKAALVAVAGRTPPSFYQASFRSAATFLIECRLAQEYLPPCSRANGAVSAASSNTNSSNYNNPSPASSAPTTAILRGRGAPDRPDGSRCPWYGRRYRTARHRRRLAPSGGHEAHCAGREKGRDIARKHAFREPRAEGRGGRAQLMGGENPAEGDARATSPAKATVGQDEILEAAAAAFER
jgi:hypothetical protein